MIGAGNADLHCRYWDCAELPCRYTGSYTWFCSYSYYLLSCSFSFSFYQICSGKYYASEASGVLGFKASS